MIMTIQTVNVSTLKRVKNNVIGNPSAKLVLAQDEIFVATYVITCSSSMPT
jgi:armadillo repeat-containing protein 8